MHTFSYLEHYYQFSHLNGLGVSICVEYTVVLNNISTNTTFTSRTVLAFHSRTVLAFHSRTVPGTVLERVYITNSVTVPVCARGWS